MRSDIKKGQVTIRDIARALGITASTVSRALHDHPNISRETKKMVNACARKMHYQRNVAASSLRTGRTNTIGIVVPRINSHFISSVIGGIEAVANKEGYHIIICQSNETLKSEINAVRTLLSKRVDGLLVSVSMETTNSKHFNEVIRKNVPLVFFDRICPDIKASSVVINDFEGAYKAVEHLIRQNRKQIVYLGGNQNLAIYRDRLAGHLKALSDYHIEADDRLVFTNHELTDQAGYQLIQSVYRNGMAPDGICAANDNLAAGAMKYLARQQVPVPDKVAIIGFSNSLFSQWMTPSLSTVDQHSQQIGFHAATILIEEIRTNPTTRKIILDPELIIRDSSKEIS